MKEKRPAEVFPPGEFIREELEARGWTQADLAEILGRPVRLVNEIIVGKRGITPETAKGLGAAFGTSAQFWLNLESSYQLGRVPVTDDAVTRRARLYTKAPIKDIVRRGWIENSQNVSVLEQRVMDFLKLQNLDAEPRFWPHAARKSTSYENDTPAQTAWLFRVQQLAQAAPAGTFSHSQFDNLISRLRLLSSSPQEVRHVPPVLAEAGIRFLVVEPLPHTRIDGVSFWLDRRPVIALSVRYDRIDYFWFTLMHELGHIQNRDGLDNTRARLDKDLVGERAQPSSAKPEPEKLADRFAVGTLIDQRALEDFIIRLRPLFSTTRIQGFANVMKVHPGIVVGQLQHRGEISYAHHRRMLVAVRSIITEAALTDGWGHVVSASL